MNTIDDLVAKLQGIADKLAAIGGELTVTSMFGEGTSSTGTAPLA